MNDFDKVKKFLDDILDEQIIFREHFYERAINRPISEELVKRTIKNTSKLLDVEEQPAKKINEKKYKIWLKLSNRYSLVLIITIEEKTLYIITGWNSDRKWQKQIQK
jgi:hypothetical protein